MSAILLLGCGIVVVLASILWLRLHAFLALVLAAYSVALFTPAVALQQFAAARKKRGEMTEKAAGQFPQKAAAARVADEFGKTCANLGVLIAMAAILSEAMLLSGAAESIAATLLRLLGAARAHWAFFSASFLLCIPVMLDTIFYLLSPLMKAVARRTHRDYLLLVMCAVAGGTITHSLVPPTPGPLFVAVELGVPLGMMIGMGTAIGLGAALSGVLFAKWSNRRHVLEVPADETPPPEETATGPILPSFWLSLLPVIVPIVLIGVAAAITPALDASSWQGWFVRTFGDKDMALTLGAIIALLILARRRNAAQASRAVGTAIGSGAAIVLIIAAGGAFGGVLRQTGIADVLGTALAARQSFVLPALFLITTLVRTAQGSATVAMITAAPIARALIESGQAHVHPVYMAIAIGCGSKPFPWMNDAGFWIITRLSGLREEQTLRTVSPMMSLQGVVGLILTMLAAALFPMQ